MKFFGYRLGYKFVIASFVQTKSVVQSGFQFDMRDLRRAAVARP